MAKKSTQPAKKISTDRLTHVTISGARVHNLKNVSVSIPRNKFTVITGLSGSGKSSLAFDTLYAEGQRRYVESLSSYARQFLGRLDKPDVDSITGISPATAIEQKITSRTSRSTVGTTTEIYDYLKLLFARIGKTISPVSGTEVKRERASDVLEYILQKPQNRFVILSPLPQEKLKDAQKTLAVLIQQGFTRVRYRGEIRRIEELTEKIPSKSTMEMVIDRVESNDDDENKVRITDSAESAFFEGLGECIVLNQDTGEERRFSNRFEADGITFEEPSVNLFTFNNPIGACKKCEGFGSVIGIDENLVIPNKNLSIYQDAVVCWRGDVMSAWKNKLIRNAAKFNFPIHKPYKEFTAAQRDTLWNGNQYFDGLHDFFQFLESESYKIQYRVMLSRYRGKTVCPECRGTRLRKDANYVKVGDKSIAELVMMQIGACERFFAALELNKQDAKIADRLLTEIRTRLGFLKEVGLEYLTLNRLSNSLSGGESQRINLATCLGSALVGSLYILDEPSVGLHPRDTERLIGVLKNLRDQGNTVIVVEHDEEIMRAADYIIDMGPEAGTLGGEVVFAGTPEELMHSGKTLTADYLNGRRQVSIQRKLKPTRDAIEIKGAREHSLKDIDVRFPLHRFTVVTGVSGSGKSTLVKKILYPGLQKELGGYPSESPGEYDAITGDIRAIGAIEFVDQNPIGKSSRSNPVTYIKAFDDIRNLFASQTLAKQRGYKPSHFSFNVEGGRCETCEGEGYQTISMQFMADIQLVCESCKGRRYKEETLEILYKGKSISHVLDMTVDDAISFFAAEKSGQSIADKLLPLQKVGLGYIGLGQSSSSLSGGEAQRVKLASFLGKGSNNQHTLFIFDEPTTGLHFHDVGRLMDSFNALLDRGHTIIAVEHNPDVIRCADWIVDLGKEGGDLGGNLLYCGPAADFKGTKDSYTAQYVKMQQLEKA